ncbi:MAG: nitroreductase [Firmicutes bacterium]|nr:nitroreductase [Bacillota bacterium]
MVNMKKLLIVVKSKGGNFMDILERDWYEIIKRRHSRRNYINKQIDSKVLEKLNKFIKKVNSFNSGVRIKIVNESCDGVFKGIIGSYGKIKGAKSYACIIGNTNENYIDEKIGYYGEALILKATSLDLGTCWVSGTFKKEAVNEFIKLEPSEKIYAITPIGYVKEDYSLTEKLMNKMISSHKRKDLNKICIEGFNSTWPKWIKDGIKCSQLAPSAINRQPWLFSVDGSVVTVQTNNIKVNKYSKRLDCGISMLHFEIGALHNKVKGKWKHLDSSKVAKFIPNER